MKYVERKDIRGKIGAVYQNTLGRLFNAAKEFFKGKESVSVTDLEAFFKSEGVEVIDAYMASSMEKLQTAIANGTVKETLRGTALRNLKEGLTPEAKKNFLTQVGERAKSISDTQKETLKTVAKEVADKNGNLLDFQTTLKERFKGEVTEGKADTIARTEYRSAYNYGQDHAVQKLADKGLEVVRIWRTSGSNVRDSHQIDGEERGPNEAFSNGLMFPMDPSADISDIINCNCSLEIVTKKREED